jgi:GNAT superfamily N-acetyltransferase
VFAAAQEELHTRRGHAWSAPRSTPSAYGRSFVAEDDGWIVGFTAAFVRSDCWYFSALFIDLADQGRGIGRQLPDHLFPL